MSASHASPPHDGPPEEVRLLLLLMDRMRGHLGAVAAVHDLTPQQALLLHHLDDDGRPMRELAGLLRCDASNVTGIADRLEVAGLVARETSGADRRVKTLVPTEQGRRVRAELAGQLAHLPPPLASLTEPERATFVALLRRMTDQPAATEPTS